MPAYALLVDSDPKHLATFEHLMKAQGLGCVLARDGELARKTVEQKGPPSVLLTELALPKLDGFGLLKWLQEKAPSTPSLAVSNFLELRNEALARREELGIRAVLAHSQPLATLERAVRAALRPPVATPSPTPAPAPVVSASRDPKRLQAIEDSGLVDESSVDEDLQSFCTEVARTFGVETALISFVQKDRQWFKAFTGLKGRLLKDRGSPVSESFCRHAVDANAPLVVPDARLNPYFAKNTLVLEGALRGYAGVPLQTSGGAVLGTLCVLDSKPLKLGAEELESLQMLGRRVAGELELRSDQKQRSASLALLARSLGLKDKGAAGGSLPLVEAVLSSLETGVLVMSGEERTLLYANRALATFAGIPVEQILKLSRDEWIAQNCTLFDDPSEFLRKMKVLPKGPFAAVEEFEMQRPVRRFLRWTAKPVQLADSVAQLCVYEDITAQKLLERQQHQLALTDELTGLLNRRGGTEALERDLARARRNQDPLCLCLLDVDGFKAVNDTYGHGVGDQVLKAVAEAAGRACRASDLVARWGGEEFLVVLPDLDLERARAVAERIRAGVERAPYGPLPKVTVSIGLAEWQGDEEPEATLARADALLYEAKAAGKNQVFPRPLGPTSDSRG